MVQLNPAKMARPVHADGRRYVPAIDGLRVLAAFGVISAHVGSEYGPSNNLVAYYGSAAYPALIVFFTISGFLVYRPFARAAMVPRSTPKTDRSTTFWVYILRRVLRIFPLYWAVLGTTVLVRGGGNLEGPVDWIQAVFLLPFPNPSTLLQGPLGIAMWTLAIELPFYVIVPLYAAGVKKLHRSVVPRMGAFELQVAAVVAVLAFIFSLGLIFGGELAFPVMSLPIGMLFAILETRQAEQKRRYRPIRFLADNWWLCLLGYVALVFLGARLALDAFARPDVTDPFADIRNVYFPIQVSQALLLFVPIAFGRRRSLSVRFMAAAPLQILAPLTYGIYLWHVPLIHYTRDWFGPGFLGFPFPGTTGFGMPTLFLAIGLAITTFVLVELPAAKLRDAVDRWSRGQTKATARSPLPDSGERSDPGFAADRVADALPEEAWRPHRKRPIEQPGDGDGGPDASHEADRSPPGGAEPAVTGGDATAAHATSRSTVRTAPPPGSARRAMSRAGEDANPGAKAQWCEPIDGFRAICACLAVTGHTFLASSIFPFDGALHVMGILVALFFAISAFVLYQPFIEADVRRQARPDAWSFYARRLLRIYPLFAFALTMYLILLPQVRPDNTWAYVRLYLFLQIFGEELSGFKGLPSAWYLANEVIFYLAMPVMAFAVARWSGKRRLKKPADRLRAHIALGWGMVFFGPLFRTLLYAADVPAPTSLPLSHLEFFGFGVVVAGYTVGMRMGIAPPSFFRWVRRNTTAAYALVLVPAVALALIAEVWGDGTGLWQDGNMEDRLRFFPYLVAIALLMSAAAMGPKRAPANVWLSSRRFKPLSALALHIYLWHQLVLGIMNRLFGGLDKVDFGMRFTTGAGLVLIALLGSITVSWVCQPFTDWPYERYRARHGTLRVRGGPSRPKPTVDAPSTASAVSPR